MTLVDERARQRCWRAGGAARHGRYWTRFHAHHWACRRPERRDRHLAPFGALVQGCQQALDFERAGHLRVVLLPLHPAVTIDGWMQLVQNGPLQPCSCHGASQTRSEPPSPSSCTTPVPWAVAPAVAPGPLPEPTAVKPPQPCANRAQATR